MLSEVRVRQLLDPFQLCLSADQVGQLLAYLDLLAQWNQKINLTAIRDPEECVTRHFGQSLYLARHFQLSGRLLDIGSGAGFPGLALKIAFPTLRVTLLEPVAKKRAFLKEVARTCSMESVEVRSERLEQFTASAEAAKFDAATSRAVGQLAKLVPLAAECLKPGGRLFLWVGRQAGIGLREMSASLVWETAIPIPLSRAAEIWAASKAA
jgi:16S rRNA (guanine527-N7)-methyltransferase